MNIKKHRFLCVAFSLLTFAGCMGIQSIIYHCLRNQNARFVSPIGEENTLIRLQDRHRLRGDVLFMGSSLTERLLPEKHFSSLGVPGSPFTTGLKLLKDSKQFAPGTVYILETNCMFANDNINILDRVSQWDFDLFRNSSHFSIAAKPINIFISGIFYFVAHEKNETDSVYNVDVETPVNLDNVPDITSAQIQKWQHLIDGVNELRVRGGRICFVYFPHVNPNSSFESGFKRACILAKYLDVPVLNYNEQHWKERLEFTDSVHLNSSRKSTKMFKNTVARDAIIHAVR